MIRLSLAVLALAATTAAAKPRVRIDVLSDPILVHKEREEVSAAVGAFLAKNGFEVVPADELERLARIAREGRSLKSDEVCGVAVAPHRVFEQQLADVEHAFASITCDKSCELAVEVGEAKRWHVALPRRPTPAQVIAAITRLKPQKAPEAYGGLVGGSLGSHLGVIFTFEHEGPWAGEPDDALEPQRAALDACATDIRRTNIGNPIVLDIAAAGSVTTCEAQEPLELPPPGFTCLCAALSKVDFGKASGPRRLRADVYHQVAGVPHGTSKIANAWVDSVHSKDPSAAFVWPGISPHALASCIPADLAVPKTWNGLPVTWRVDAHGHATKTTVDVPGAPPAVKRCLDAALATATFACPQGGGDVDITAALSIVLSDH